MRYIDDSKGTNVGATLAAVAGLPGTLVLVAGGDFNHGFTYSGHPVACAAALENIRIIEEEKLRTGVSGVGGFRAYGVAGASLSGSIQKVTGLPAGSPWWVSTRSEKRSR